LESADFISTLRCRVLIGMQTANKTRQESSMGGIEKNLAYYSFITNVF